MVKVLFATIMMILGLGGLIFLYKRFKNQLPFVTSKKVTTEEYAKEPATISEAVSSFIRHRLKR